MPDFLIFTLLLGFYSIVGVTQGVVRANRGARIMLAQIDGLEYDDGHCDLSQQIYMKQLLMNNDSQPEGVSIYPNPTSTNVMVIINSPGELTGKFKLINILGETVLETTIPEKTTSLNVDVSGVRGGCYYYRVESENETLNDGKLIIIR